MQRRFTAHRDGHWQFCVCSSCVVPSSHHPLPASMHISLQNPSQEFPRLYKWLARDTGRTHMDMPGRLSLAPWRPRRGCDFWPPARGVLENGTRTEWTKVTEKGNPGSGMPTWSTNDQRIWQQNAFWRLLFHSAGLLHRFKWVRPASGVLNIPRPPPSGSRRNWAAIHRVAGTIQPPSPTNLYFRTPKNVAQTQLISAIRSAAVPSVLPGCDIQQRP